MTKATKQYLIDLLVEYYKQPFFDRKQLDDMILEAINDPKITLQSLITRAIEEKYSTKLQKEGE